MHPLIDYILIFLIPFIESPYKAFLICPSNQAYKI